MKQWQKDRLKGIEAQRLGGCHPELLIEEYQLMESFKIPIAKSLNDAPAQKIRDFFIIKDELAFLQKNLSEKRRGKN